MARRRIADARGWTPVFGGFFRGFTGCFMRARKVNGRGVTGISVAQSSPWCLRVLIGATFRRLQ